jgi:hypothetical protein
MQIAFFNTHQQYTCCMQQRPTSRILQDLVLGHAWPRSVTGCMFSLAVVRLPGSTYRWRTTTSCHLFMMFVFVDRTRNRIQSKGNKKNRSEYIAAHPGQVCLRNVHETTLPAYFKRKQYHKQHHTTQLDEYLRLSACGHMPAGQTYCLLRCFIIFFP